MKRNCLIYWWRWLKWRVGGLWALAPLCRTTTSLQLISSIYVAAGLPILLFNKEKTSNAHPLLFELNKVSWLMIGWGDGMEEPLGVKLITFHSVIWKSLIFNGGSSGSKPFHPSTNQPLHSNKQKVVCFHCVAEMVDWISFIIKK